MKASLKFREDQKPLIKAKIPISILGLPFLSGISAGDSKELRLDLLTAFESGPSLRASYRPNDPSNPFTLSLKTGIGSLGSPAGAPMSMTAEFNILGGNPNPSFTVLFKPRLGDFSFKKLTGSAVISPVNKKMADVDGDPSAVWVVTPPPLSNKVNAWWPAGIGAVSGMLTGVEVNAKSVLPLKSNAAVRFKWGVRVPAEFQNALVEEGNRRFAFGKLPLLVMSKISIEHVAADDKTKRKEEGKVGDVSKGVVGAADVAEACMSMKKQLDAIQVENGILRRAVEELKGSIPVSTVAGPTRDADISRGGKREGKHLEASGRAAQKEEDVNEELKKALMGTTGGAN